MRLAGRGGEGRGGVVGGSSQGFIWRFYFAGETWFDNFKDSKKGHNTPAGAFATPASCT